VTIRREGSAAERRVDDSARMISGPWSSGEIRYLRGHAKEGSRAIAEALGRTVAAVERKAHRMRVELRKPGSRRGIMLSQTRGESWTSGENAIFRTQALSGALSLSLIERRIAEDAANPPALCPACGRWPARHTASGLCFTCYAEERVRQYHEIEQQRRAQREIQAAAKQAERAAECSVPGCRNDANGTGGLCWTHTRVARKRERT